MGTLNPDQLTLDLKGRFGTQGLGTFFDLNLDVFKQDIKTIETIRAAATKLRELGFEAGIVLDTDEYYHEFFIRHVGRQIYLCDTGTSEIVLSENQDKMRGMVNSFSPQEEELLVYFADLQRAREGIYCNIVNTINIILFPDFHVTRQISFREKRSRAMVEFKRKFCK